jgi:ubiquinone/menaquinone biosynthesis C-methylase UbiE
MHENLNKELYSNKLFKVWVDKYNLIPLEEYFFKKYLLNKNGKVIEAGTGGGRLIFEIEKLGFKKLDAFDYVNNMINFCKEKKKQLKSRVNFKVAEVNDLSHYNSLDFDYLIYLQQVLCFIDKEDLVKRIELEKRIVFIYFLF